MKKSIIRENLKSAQSIIAQILQSPESIDLIHTIAGEILSCFQHDGRLLLCGNGGSAADAEHLAAEFSGRYYLDRPPLQAEALHVNSAFLTAVSNDYTYDIAYARMVESIGRKGDVLIGLSTSGQSLNVVNALEKAQMSGLLTIGFTGKNRGAMDAHCDLLFSVPSNDTPRVQECHMLIGHCICQIVEQAYFNA